MKKNRTAEVSPSIVVFLKYELILKVNVRIFLSANFGSQKANDGLNEGKDLSLGNMTFMY